MSSGTTQVGLHALHGHHRKRLEQLGRCITRAALADERVQLNDAGQRSSSASAVG